MSKSTASFFARLLVLFASFFAATAYAAPGDVLGKVLAPLPNGFSQGIEPLVQPDGKIIVVGTASRGQDMFTLTRFNADGSLDTAYGDGGTRYQAIAPLSADARDALLQDDGKVVVVGDLNRDTNGTGQAAIARFNADGTLDESFAGGAALANISSGWSGGEGVARQSTGQYVVAVNARTMTSGTFGAVRFNADGTRDNSFGSGGAWLDTDSAFELIRGVVAQPDDKLLLFGDHGGITKIVRLNADGSLDATWGTGGSMTVNAFTALDALVQPDGNIVFAGAVNPGQDMGLFRLTPSGTLDPTFGSSGIASTSVQGEFDGFARLPDGKFVAAGTAATSSPFMFLYRFNPDGSLDASFGNNGQQTAQFSTGARAGKLALRGDGRFVVAGLWGTMLTAAFTAAGTLDSSFAGTGFRILDLGSGSGMFTGSAVQSDGKIVFAGTRPAVITDIFGSGSMVTRYLADGTLDTSFGTNGLTLYGTSNTNAVAIQPDGKIVTGGMIRQSAGENSWSAMTFSRFNIDGSPDTSFGSAGTVILPVNNAQEWVQAVAIQPDGKIVGAGYLQNGFARDGYVTRVNANGTLDTTFGNSGFATVAMSAGADQIFAMALQNDGRIVVAGGGDVSGSQTSMTAARLNDNGTLDTSFGGGTGMVMINFGAASSWAYGVALQPDGKIVLGGQAHPATNDDYALARLNANGTLDTGFGTGGTVTSDFAQDQNGLRTVVVLADGKIAGAGKDQGGTFGVVRYNANGTLDTTFGSGGHVAIPMNFNIGADAAFALSIGANGTMYAAGNASGMPGFAMVAGDSGAVGAATAAYGFGSSQNPSTAGQAVSITVTLSGNAGTPTGTVTFNDNGAAISGCGTLALASGSATCTSTFSTAGAHPITVTYSGDVNYAASTSSAFTQTVNPQVASGALQLSPASLDFGGESMNTTSPGQAITVTNTGGTTVTISGIAVTSQFGQSNNCSSLAAGDSCTITVTFSPAVAAGALNSRTAVTGTLTVSSNASGNPNTAPLSGTAEKSLVTHYYRSILRRAPDSAGHDFWESEAARVAGLGANVNETWYALAMSFFNTPEYANFHTDNAGYLTDLYLTFFNRAPDQAGFDFWMDQMNQGMPRDGVLANFMFSPEFKNFTEAIFGNTAVRAEIDMTMDMYRGTLARLPDSAGFQFYLGEFRKAQCQSADAVRSEADTVSSGFLNSAEYGNRQRTNAQYMADLYNTLLRRGPDLAGINFYIGQLDSGAQTRESIRQQFVASPEFSNRVTNVANAGCTQ